jgi:hypothetical protein
MTPADRFRFGYACGQSTMRCVTLDLPVAGVRELLPAGLELDEAGVTNGKYPVIMLFEQMHGVQISVPFPGMDLVPGLDYHEHSINIPDTYISSGPGIPARLGPYNFMAKLYLDHLAPTATGLLFWGLPKELALIQVSYWRYAVSSLTGWPLTSLTWEDDPEPKETLPTPSPLVLLAIERLRQSIVSRLPAGLGPMFVVSDCQRDFYTDTLFKMTVEVNAEFLPGYSRGRYPPLEGFESRTSFRLSLPYLPA